jgi:hypothetical protein
VTRLLLILKAMTTLSDEIAVEAARLVADHGLDYGSAKKKAAEAIAGVSKLPRDAMPDNHQIDDALLEHLNLFDEEHSARVQRMREVAFAMMRHLYNFDPMLTGSVWKGIVAEHVPIHIQVFSDNSKEVQFALLNLHIEYDSIESKHFRTGSVVEALTFHWKNEPIMISMYNFDDLRGAVKERIAGGTLQGKPVRANLKAVEQLLAEGLQ